MRSFLGKTNRFTWRSLEHSDAIFLQNAIQESIDDSEWYYFPVYQNLKTKEQLKHHISSYLLQAELRNGGLFGIFDSDNKLLGTLYLYWVSEERESAAIGFWLSKTARQKGVLAEVLPSFLQFLFSELKLNRIEAEVAFSNKKSISVLEKAFFVQEGLAREYAKVNGTFEDFYHYSLIFSDFQEKYLNKKEK
ncbi:MAG: GNAT family protein [Fibrobacteraceae bacterium]|jgi:RimJ/RimL family protein N-acetyltransferase|nr:GNAT family protein [Fibrobacteraceae bacterium]